MAQENKSKVSILTNGIIKENPVLRLVLGTCSILAVTTAVSSALGMGAAFTFVLVCSNIMISLLRKVIPGKVHLPCYIVIIASFVTIVQMFMQAYMESLYNALGVFLPLIVVNCIILGRAEMFACKNNVVDSALDGVGMGAAFTFVLVCSNILISLLRNVIPAKVHLPCYIVIIAGFVTIVQMVMHAYMDSLYTALGVFLPLIVVNCIILGRAEMFACKNNVVDSALDGVGMGIGYTLTVVLMATIREVLGSGTWLGFQIIPEGVAKVSIMTQAPGAFFCFGLLMAGCVWLEGKLDARIERKSCCDLDNLKKEAE